MAKPNLWLAIATIILATVVVLLLTLLALGVFQQHLTTLTIQETLDAASNSPWSSFLPQGQCQIYTGVVQTGQANPPTGMTNSNLNCTPLNDVAAIKTVRTCLKSGCIDLTNTARNIGYVEEVYQDCSKPFSCNANEAVCYVAKSSCEDLGQSLVRIQTDSLCLTRPNDVTLGSLAANSCGRVETNRNQQFNFVPTAAITLGQPYAVTVPGTANCVVGPSQATNVNTTAQLNPCSSVPKGAFIITPEVEINIPYSVGASSYTFAATRPSQLLWLPNTDNAPKTIPIDFMALKSFAQSNLSLQGNELKSFIPACTNSLDTLPVQLIGQVLACPVNSFIPSARVIS